MIEFGTNLTTVKKGLDRLFGDPPRITATHMRQLAEQPAVEERFFDVAAGSQPL